PSWEVYRVDRDPLETEDLAGDDDTCRATRDAVARWCDEAPAAAVEALLHDQPDVATPLADLGTSVRLLSVVAPAQAHPGETITLTWTFAALGPVAAGWKVFVHVEGPAKGTFVNADHAPARPVEWWQPGDHIRYSTTGALPPHAHRLQNGLAMYPPPSIEFIPYLYTPLYPSLLAVLGNVFGLGYVLGRVLSVLSLVGIAVIGTASIASPRHRHFARGPA